MILFSRMFLFGAGQTANNVSRRLFISAVSVMPSLFILSRCSAGQVGIVVGLFACGRLARSSIGDVRDLLHHLPMKSGRFVDGRVGQGPIRSEIDIGEFALKTRTWA